MEQSDLLRPVFARNAYSGSIGGWKRKIGNKRHIIDAWHAFSEREVDRRILEFLHDHGIEPEWRET